MLSKRAVILARLAGRIVSGLLLVQSATWRRNEECLRKIDELRTKGRKTIIAFWHGKYTPLFIMLRGLGGCIFVSDSHRGEIIAEICRRFGHDPVRIPDKGGRESLNAMKEALAGHTLAGVAVDGPLGPRHRVKQGVINLASEMGYNLLPVSVWSRRSRVLDGRWDKMEIPGMFTRIKLLSGEIMEVPDRLDRGEVRAWSRRLEDALKELDDRVSGADC